MKKNKIGTCFYKITKPLSYTRLEPLLHYDNLLINRQGEIFSKNNNKYLKYQVNENGYPKVTITSENRITTSYLVHRLVGIMFIENLFDKRTINHKDRDRANFHVRNLEWATQRENNAHKMEQQRLHGHSKYSKMYENSDW